MSSADPAGYPANHHSSPKADHSPQMTPEGLPKAAEPEPRLIIVSNRLPVTIDKDANGEYTFKVSNDCLTEGVLANNRRCPPEA